MKINIKKNLYWVLVFFLHHNKINYYIKTRKKKKASYTS